MALCPWPSLSPPHILNLLYIPFHPLNLYPLFSSVSSLPSACQVRMGFGLHAGWAIEGAVGSLQKVIPPTPHEIRHILSHPTNTPTPMNAPWFSCKWRSHYTTLSIHSINTTYQHTLLAHLNQHTPFTHIFPHVNASSPPNEHTLSSPPINSPLPVIFMQRWMPRTSPPT